METCKIGTRVVFFLFPFSIKNVDWQFLLHVIMVSHVCLQEIGTSSPEVVVTRGHLVSMSTDI